MDDATDKKELTKLSTEANTNLSKTVNAKTKSSKSEKKNKTNEKSKLEALETEVKEDSSASSTSNNVSKKRVQFN